MGEPRVQELTAQIIVYLIDNGEGSPYEISNRIGSPYGSVYRAMERMRQQGLLTARSVRSKKNVHKRLYKLTGSDKFEKFVNKAIDIVDKRTSYNMR